MNKLKPGQLYVTATEYDNNLYKAFLGMRLKSRGYNPASVSITLKKDLNAPSIKEQRKTFNQLYKKNKESINRDISDWMVSKDKAASKKEVLKQLSEKSLDDIYEDFMNSIESPSSSKKKFYKELKKNGYNAVVDEHDITGSWMQGVKPLIIMDTLNTLGDMKIEELTVRKMQDALEDWLNGK